MESKIFAKLNFDPGILVIGSLVATVILIILVLVLLLKQSRLENNYKIFMKGRGGRSLQDMFKQQLESMDIVKEQTDLLHRRITYVEKSLNRSYQKCGIVKYDAFKEMGGQLSFAMAMLNDSNTGFVINSIHSRDGSYTYIKDIIRGECSIELCEEEKEALKIAVDTAGSTPALTKTEKRRKKKSKSDSNPTAAKTADSADKAAESSNNVSSVRESKEANDVNEDEKNKKVNIAAVTKTVRKGTAKFRRSSVKQAVINSKKDKEEEDI